MMETRVPASVMTSMALHVGGFAAYLLFFQTAQKADLRIITDVDLLVAPPPETRAQEAAPKPPPPASIRDFLKLALPSIPKPAPAHVPLEVKAPELRKALMDMPQPKLEDRGRLQKAAAIEALDLDRRRESLAKVDAGLSLRASRAAPILGPRLDEVGMRQAPRKVIEMAALEEKREQLAPRGLQAMAPEPSRSRSLAPAAPLLAPEAAPRPENRSLGTLARMLPAQPLEPASAPRELPSIPKRAIAPPAALAPRARDEGPQAAPKKAVEIEGPLSDRQVVSASVPQFPQWAKEQGVVESAVSIRFTVDPAGKVLESMRVERTSGFGRMDRLAMEHLKLWRFAPVSASEGNQWGIITFRFILE